MAKKQIIDMGYYIPSEKEQKAYSWCINNGIYISPKVSNSSSEWYLLVQINNNINISPKTYKKVEIWKELFNYYVYYYDKYENKV
jgi:hypothetical protein